MTVSPFKRIEDQIDLVAKSKGFALQYGAGDLVADYIPTSILGLREHLEHLMIDGGTLDNIEILGDMNLKFISISNTKITDITPLSRMETLNSLLLTNNEISDASIISRFPRLDTLWLREKNVTNIDFVKTAKFLKELNIDKTSVDEKALTALAQNSTISNIIFDECKAVYTNSILKDISEIESSRARKRALWEWCHSQKATNNDDVTPTYPKPPKSSTPYPPPPKPQQYYFSLNEKVTGPFSIDEVVERLIPKNEIGAHHYVWSEGMDDWIKAQSLPELQPHLNALQTPKLDFK